MWNKQTEVSGSWKKRAGLDKNYEVFQSDIFDPVAFQTRKLTADDDWHIGQNASSVFVKQEAS